MSFETIFCVTAEEEAEIKTFYGKDDEEIIVMVDSLKNWVETQLQLPQNQEDYFLEMMLKLNKFKEEKTKKKIDMYYTIRNIVPEFFEDRSPLCQKMQKFMESIMIVPLPQLSESLERIYLVRILDIDPANFDLLQNARYLLALFDLRLKHDKAVGERYIYDLSGLSFGHIFKINPLVVKKIYTVMESAYSDRIKGIHFLNMPLVGNAIISLAKLILSDKLANRVNSHKNLNSLTDVVPAQLLPSDYNGSQKSSEELYDEWKKSFQNSADWINEIGNQKSNEELRIHSEESSSLISGLFNMLKNHDN